MAELNRHDQVQDPSEVLNDDDMADAIYNELHRCDLSKTFVLNPNLKLITKKLADRLLSTSCGFSPVGLLYYIEGNYPVPIIGWMTKSDPHSCIKDRVVSRSKRPIVLKFCRLPIFATNSIQSHHSPKLARA